MINDVLGMWNSYLPGVGSSSNYLTNVTLNPQAMNEAIVTSNNPMLPFPLYATIQTFQPDIISGETNSFNQIALSPQSIAVPSGANPRRVIAYGAMSDPNTISFNNVPCNGFNGNCNVTPGNVFNPTWTRATSTMMIPINPMNTLMAAPSQAQAFGGE